MKKLLVSAAAATMLMAAVPAFAASPADDAEQGIAAYPPVGHCHFLPQRAITQNGHVLTQNGHVVLRRQQICE